ncbi:MAG: MGMT family protein [Mycobacteriales bacterium]
MTPYAERVRAVVAAIPSGRVSTYDDIARRMGEGGARSVGGVLSRYGEGLPCHRVVRSDGSVKRVDPERNAALLRAEGVLFAGPDRVDLDAARWLPAYADRVLAVVDRIPVGRVMTFGDVAEYLGESSGRAVGRVMAHSGGVVPWHRVVLSTGAPAPGHQARALELLRADGTPLSSDGTRVDLRRARWDGS